MDEQHNTIIREQEYSDAATQRTIIDLIDIETGEFVDANMLDTMTEAELSGLKELQSLAKKSGEYKYVCAVCGQPLRLDSRHYASRKYKSYFFSHYSNGDDCPLKTSSDAVDPVRSTIKWYSRFKESPLHKDMCQKLMNILSIDERFSNVVSYPTINIYGEDVHWHKPDVASDFYGNQLVFETLMYNTFLSNVIDKNSFYRMANSFLLWVFPHFSIDNQTMCEKDVYYTHRRNIFVFDSEDYYRTDNDKDSSKPQKPVFAEKGYLYAQEESIKRGRLMLNCYWQIPVIQGKEVKIEWHHKLVDIAELTFDAIRKDAFFHDSDYDFKEVADPHKRELIENWERAKEDRWSKIFKGIQERKEHFEQTESRKIARENEQNMLTRIFSGEIIPEPFKVGDIYGYKAEDVVVIKPQYAMAFPFRNGTAIVINKRGRRGLINLRNERILDIKYNKLGRLDKDNPNILFGTEGSPTPFNLFYSTGEKVVDYLINGIKKINGNYVFIKYSNKGFGIMSDEGKVLIEPIYGKIAPKEDDRYILTYAGRTKTIKSDISDVRTNIITELMPGNFIAERLLFYGVVDASGDTVLPFRYSKIERFSEKYISVEEKDGSTLYNGLMDNSFNMVMPMKTAQITVLPNGAILREGTLYDSNLKALLVGYDSIEPCPDGKYILCKRISSGWYKSYNKYGLADETGNILFPCVALQAVKNKNDNVDYIVEYLGNGGSIRSCFAIFGLFDASGQLLTGRIYTKMEKLPNGNLLVTYNNKQGIITQTGEEVVPCNYDSLNLTDSGEVKVITEPLDGFCQKYGYLDKYALSDMDGNLLTNYIFDEIDLLSEGLYVAKDYNSRSLLDRFGHIINKSSDDTEFHPLDGGSILVIEDGIRYGIMNREGLLIIPVDFSFIELLPNGNFLVRQENYRETLYGVFKPDGSVLVECIYHEICTDSNGDIRPKFIPLNEDFFKACQFDKYALANRSKVLLTDFLYESLEVFDDNNYLVTLNGQNGLIDSEGQVVLSLTINDVISVISNDRFLVGKPFKKGVLDSKGAVVVPVEYYNIEKLPNDTWKVDKVQYANHLFGIYGDDGNVIYECKYEEILTDSDGNVIPSFSGNDDFVFKARLLDKYALCSKEKTVLTDYLYDDIIYSGDGFLIVISNTQQGVIDYEGNIVLPLCDLVIEKVIDRNLFIIQDNFSRLYIVNEAGKALTSEMYADITVLKNKTYIGKRNDPHSWPYGYLYDYINDNGEILFTSDKKIEIDDNGLPATSIVMTIGHTVVKECSGKYAIGNEESISFSDYFFDSVEKLNDTILIVGMSKKYGLANLQGMLILPAKYSHEFEFCSMGIIKFCNDDNLQKYYGLCDSSGKILAEAEYTFIRENNPGSFKLFYKEGREQKSKYLNFIDPVSFVVGQTYTGRISGIQEYGLFVKVQGGGSGLLHVKQIKRHGKDINSFSKGDKISVKVINIRKDGKVEFDLV
jgi:hypothetical protein